MQTPWMLEGLGNLRDASQRPRRRSRGAWLSWLFALFAVLSLTAAIGSRYYNEPQLTIRTPAPQTLYAPQNAQVEDKIATSEARKAARQSALNAFTISEPATEQINADFTNLLTQAQSLRRLAGALPYVSTGLLSTEVQRTLRSIDRSQLETLLSALALDSNPRSETFSPPALKQSWAELQALASRPLSARQEIAQRSRQANDQYQFARRSASDELAALQVEPILDISDSGWTALKTRSRDILQKMLIQGIAPGLLPDVTQRAVAVQVKDWDVLEQQAALQLLPAVLRSNVVLNPAESFRQQERAAQQIQPIEVQIRRGDLIVRQGQPITSASFALLDHFGLSRREPNFSGLLLVMMAISGAVGIYAKLTRSHRSWRYLDDALVLLLALSAPLMIGVTEVVYTTLPAVGVLLGSFYGARLGAAAVLLLGLLIPLGLQVSGMTFGVIVLGSLVGSVMAGFARSREELARVSIILGATQTVAYIVLLGLRDPFGLDSAWGIALRQGLIGVGWCIIAIGVSPYLEKLFDLITPVRLAELANPNRPLLKKLAETAPGTFQHTHFVTTLAEAGARALDCNVELVRTGTLYHDIGKMHDPQAFIENQFGAPNKHAEINDPWVSAELIRKHVTEGLVMARKAGLPGAVQAFIPEHQGTMLISYFYQQACQMEQAKPAPVPIHEEDFRYAGPAPQSRETGIVMLADSCEAALRSMKQEDPAVALRTINQIFKARWQGDQLKDSGLNREDLKTLAQVFVCVWQQVNHQRIPYPQPLAPLPHASRWPRP
ncbi:MAG: HDIG domain-containing protein [Thermosynechococcaceae cyanobacterium MS004]|nr:HDIG domain-containing protein [Thermosynechococcaceae cyanobacterium MS004]